MFHIEVTHTSPGAYEPVVDHAEADTPSGVILAVRTLWDESRSFIQGAKTRVVITADHDPKFVRVLTKRP